MIKVTCDYCETAIEELKEQHKVVSGHLCQKCYDNYRLELATEQEKYENKTTAIEKKYHDTPKEDDIDPNHEHIWTLSFTARFNEDRKTTYHCKPCGEFKEEDGVVATDRGHNRGGEFSTSWRP